MKRVKIRRRDLHKFSDALGRLRHRLYSLIASSPGLHFREIQRRTKMATGQLLYHLNYLMDMALIKTTNDGQYLRYYTHDEIGVDERRVLELARQRSVRRILLYVLEHDNCNHEEISKNMDLSPSTISWHLKKLIDSDIMNKNIDGRKSFYSVNDPNLVRNVLIKYRRSFLDKLVDRFTEM